MDNFQIVRLICQFNGDNLYEFVGNNHLNKVGLIIFDRLTLSSLIIANGDSLELIRINTGDEQMCKRVLTNAKVIIAGKTCVSNIKYQNI